MATPFPPQAPPDVTYGLGPYVLGLVQNPPLPPIPQPPPAPSAGPILSAIGNLVTVIQNTITPLIPPDPTFGLAAWLQQNVLTPAQQTIINAMYGAGGYGVSAGQGGLAYGQQQASPYTTFAWQKGVYPAYPTVVNTVQPAASYAQQFYGGIPQLPGPLAQYQAMLPPTLPTTTPPPNPISSYAPYAAWPSQAALPTQPAPVVIWPPPSPPS